MFSLRQHLRFHDQDSTNALVSNKTHSLTLTNACAYTNACMHTCTQMHACMHAHRRTHACAHLYTPNIEYVLVLTFFTECSMKSFATFACAFCTCRVKHADTSFFTRVVVHTRLTSTSCQQFEEGNRQPWKNAESIPSSSKRFVKTVLNYQRFCCCCKNIFKKRVVQWLQKCESQDSSLSSTKETGKQKKKERKEIKKKELLYHDPISVRVLKLCRNKKVQQTHQSSVFFQAPFDIAFLSFLFTQQVQLECISSVKTC